MPEEVTPAELVLRDMPPADTGFSVAFSFAGEQRALVKSIAEACEARLGRGTVFFDEWFEYLIGGSNAEKFLQKIYGKQTQMMVLCVAQHYDQKPWPLAEAAAIQSRVFTLRTSADARDRLRFMPIRVGEGGGDWLMANDVILDARAPARTPDVMAQLIIRRLAEIDTALVPPTAPKGTALLLPCIPALAHLSAALQSSLESMDIAVLRPDPLLPAADLALFATNALQQAHVVVEWFQRSDLPEDRPFIECHDQIRKLHAALPAAQRRTALMWLPPDTPPLGAAATETSARRMLFEQFKKTVLDAATAPRQAAAGRIVIGAPRVDGTSVQQLVGIFPAVTPRDSQYDKLHQPPTVNESEPDVDERLLKALRKTPRSLVLIDGTCSRTWIEERLRTYELYSESAVRVPQLIVWDVPQPVPKPPREFWPETPGAVLIASANAADVAAAIYPPLP